MQLKIVGVFTKYRGKVGGIKTRHDEVHCTDIARTLFYDAHASLDRLAHSLVVESLDVVEYLFRTDSSFLPDSYTLELAVKNEDMSTIKEGHVVLDADPFISKCAPRMCQKQCRIAEAGEISFPYGPDVVMETPLSTTHPGTAPSMTLILRAVFRDGCECLEMLVNCEGQGRPDIKQAAHILSQATRDGDPETPVRWSQPDRA